MRTDLTVLIFLFLGQITFGQDGGDMHYIKPDALTADQIGKFVHVDLGTRSFALHKTKRPLETVPIELNGKKINFIEHRVDDGYNNWFKSQYLESVDDIDGNKLRIVKHKLLSIDGDSIRVESYFDAFDKKGNQVPGKSFTRELSFRKKDLAEVLIHVK